MPHFNTAAERRAYEASLSHDKEHEARCREIIRQQNIQARELAKRARPKPQEHFTVDQYLYVHEFLQQLSA